MTHVQHVDSVRLDDEEEPVPTGASTVDRLPDVLRELYALRDGHTPVRVSSQGADGIIDLAEPFDSGKRARSLIQS